MENYIFPKYASMPLLYAHATFQLQLDVNKAAQTLSNKTIQNLKNQD